MKRILTIILGTLISFVPMYAIGLIIGHYLEFGSKETAIYAALTGLVIIFYAFRRQPPRIFVANIGYALAIYAGIFY